MKILLDHNLPMHLKAILTGHIVFTAREMGWDSLKNGALLSIAEEATFQVPMIGDQTCPLNKTIETEQWRSSFSRRSNACLS